jgi:DNA primase
VLYVPRPLTAKDTSVFIVEGPTDAVAICQSGHASVAVIGAKLSEEQILLLRSIATKRKVILLPDNDEEGERCVQVLQKELPLVVRHLPTQYKDICDLPQDYRDSFLAGVS